MDVDNRISILRDRMIQAIAAQDKLLDSWRSCRHEDCVLFGNAGDIEILRELILRRIYPINAFEALVQVDLNAALEILFSRYLGNNVDPDRKFGGFSYELEGMLEELKLAGGEEAIRTLITRSNFNTKLLKDARVIEAFANALDISTDQFASWALDQLSA